MRIAHVVQQYLPGLLTGSELYMRHISEDLTERGHEIYLLTSKALDNNAFIKPWGSNLSNRSFERINGVNVIRFSISYNIQIPLHVMDVAFDRCQLRHGIGSYPFMPNLFFHLRMNKGVYDLVHATAYPLVHTWLVAKACHKSKTPYIITPFFHPGSPQYYRQELLNVLRNANAVFACTTIERHILVSLGVQREKIHLVPMGIDVQELSGCSGQRFRRKFGLEDKFIILFAGSKCYDKGAMHVLEAVKHLAKEKNNVVLVAMGLATPDWLKAVGSSKGSFLLDLPYLSGTDKTDVFDACNVLVMPSQADAFGIVYLEAWYLGKPVIGAKSGGVPAVITDGVDGFLVKFGDLQNLINKIQSLMNDPALAKKLGDNGRKKVVANYTWFAIVDKVERIYKDVIDNRLR
jgi:glycosyltransferase involved in cell wall biosynthesis